MILSEIFANEKVYGLLLAALLGAFLGIRREIEAQESTKNRSFMGLRTMTLLAVLGALSTFFPALPMLPIVGFVAVLALVSIAYAHGSFSMNRIGITTELSAILIYWIGVMCTSSMQTLAIGMTVFLAIINAYKLEFRSFVHTITKKEWNGALQFFILSAVVLPLLPREAIDPWGALVPFDVWVLVLLISGLGFMGYFLTKYFGARAGIPLTAFLGALVSSTAVTVSMAEQSNKKMAPELCTEGIMVGLATMQTKVALLVLLLSGGLIHYGLAVSILAMAATGVGLAVFFAFLSRRETGSFFGRVKRFFIRGEEADTDYSLSLRSPFEIAPALKFGLIFVVVLFAIYFGKQYLGRSGVYMAALLSGFVDIDAVVLSSLESLRHGDILALTARDAIAIGIVVNTVIKAVYVGLLGTREMLRQVFFSVLLMTIIGVGTYFLFL